MYYYVYEDVGKIILKGEATCANNPQTMKRLMQRMYSTIKLTSSVRAEHYF